MSWKWNNYTDMSDVISSDKNFSKLNQGIQRYNNSVISHKLLPPSLFHLMAAIRLFTPKRVDTFTMRCFIRPPLNTCFLFSSNHYFSHAVSMENSTKNLRHSTNTLRHWQWTLDIINFKPLTPHSNPNLSLNKLYACTPLASKTTYAVTIAFLFSFNKWTENLNSSDCDGMPGVKSTSFSIIASSDFGNTATVLSFSTTALPAEYFGATICSLSGDFSLHTETAEIKKFFFQFIFFRQELVFKLL